MVFTPRNMSSSCLKSCHLPPQAQGSKGMFEALFLYSMLLHPRRMPAHSLACQERSFNDCGPKRREREGAIEKCERGRSIIQPGRETRNASETCRSLIHRVADSLARVKTRDKIALPSSAAVAENNYAVENEGRWVGRRLALIGVECDCFSCAK